MTLTQVLDSAVERGLLDSNPARGKRRRLKAVKPMRRQLEADDLKELLAVAGDMDRNLYRGHQIGRRPMIAAMASSGCASQRCAGSDGAMSMSTTSA